jgi:cell division septation protein DedD
VIALLLLSALFFMGYHWHDSKLNNAKTAATAFVKSPDPSPAAPTGSTNQALVPASPLEEPEFALQVVATTDKKAAEALAATLKRRYFPAFVYFRGTDQFYRVLVGPYSDSASRVRTEELKAEGFESFRTPWNPSAAPSPLSALSP